ncbi:MAG: 30S ribosomal protein S20 [Pseudomonadota bacterium]
MANTSSAKKMVRKIERRTAVNKSRRSRVRTYLRRVEEAIEAGNADQAQAAFREATSELQRAVTHGIVHKNTASRKLSRLSSRIKAVAA